MAENLSSDTPKFWHEQNLLRILTKSGGNTLSPRSKWKFLLSLCFLDPYITLLSPRRTRRLCGGESSSSPTLVSNMTYCGKKLKEETKELVPKQRNLLSYLFEEIGWWHLIGAASQGMLQTKRLQLDFQQTPATTRLKEPRGGARRTSGHPEVPRGQRLWKYLLICGPSKFAAHALST